MYHALYVTTGYGFISISNPWTFGLPTTFWIEMNLLIERIQRILWLFFYFFILFYGFILIALPSYENAQQLSSIVLQMYVSVPVSISIYNSDSKSSIVLISFFNSRFKWSYYVFFPFDATLNEKVHCTVYYTLHKLYSYQLLIKNTIDMLLNSIMECTLSAPYDTQTHTHCI